MKQFLKRIIVTLPLALTLAVVIICTVSSFTVWVLTGSGPIQSAINRFSDYFYNEAAKLVAWAK